MASPTTPVGIERVKGFPSTLQIYRIPASRFWQVRYFVDGRYVRRSTGKEAKTDAIQAAKSLYESVALARRLDATIHPTTFAACAKHLMDTQRTLVAQAQRRERIIYDDERKLKKDILPFFGSMDVDSVKKQTIKDYIAKITEERSLSSSTLKQHIVLIRKVLKEAYDRDFIKAIPLMPQLKTKDRPRPYIDLADYRRLRHTTKIIISEGRDVRGVPFTYEFYDFLIFAVNSFLRISDLKLLKHRDVKVERIKRGRRVIRYLSLIPTNSKTVVRESMTMPIAAIVYDRINERHKTAGFGAPDDYVFFPQLKNRAYALQTMRRQLECALDRASIRKDRLGRNRTLYSLRHTALMYRIIKSENLDIFLLARNALTSVEQLQRFYLSHTEATMKIDALHSMKRI